MLTITGIHSGTCQLFYGFFIGIPQRSNGGIRCSHVVLHLVLRDIDTALDAPLCRGCLSKIGQFLFIKFPDPFLHLLFFGNIHKNAIKILLAVFHEHLGFQGYPFYDPILAD